MTAIARKNKPPFAQKIQLNAEVAHKRDQPCLILMYIFLLFVRPVIISAVFELFLLRFETAGVVHSGPPTRDHSSKRARIDQPVRPSVPPPALATLLARPPATHLAMLPSRKGNTGPTTVVRSATPSLCGPRPRVLALFLLLLASSFLFSSPAVLAAPSSARLNGFVTLAYLPIMQQVRATDSRSSGTIGGCSAGGEGG